MPAGLRSRPRAWRRIARCALGFASLLSFLMSVLCAWFFYALYLRWDFDEQGRHFDAPASVVYTDSASIWGVLAGVFLLLALGFLAVTLRSRER